MKTVKILAIALLSLSIYSCTDDDDDSVKPGVTITPNEEELITTCLLYTSPSPRDGLQSRMPSSA